MQRRTPGDFDAEVMRLFDHYVHGRIDRRGFLEGAARHARAGMTAAMLLEALNPNYAQAQQVKPDDPRLAARYVQIDSPAGHGKLRGYLVKPQDAPARLPAILVVHENRGLNPHIEDVTRRAALERFVAFAPDALSPLGGYPGNDDQARAAFARLDQAKSREDFIAAAAWLREQRDVNGRVGVVGFCYGGAMANLLAVRLPWIAAAVPFYGGSQPSAADAARIKAVVMIHNAESDEWVNAGAKAYVQALQAAGVRHEDFTYPGTVHGFHNDTTPRYDEGAAKLAWQRTMALFNRELRG
jgi:carboxymethylenebutenolidase